MAEPRKWTYLMDMDGVLVHEEHLIPGADKLIDELRAKDIQFLVLTNNSIYTPRDLRARLHRTGLDVPESAIWTSALATAKFLDSQRPDGSAFVIGEAGLTTALHEIGYVLTDRDPDYVVLGETRTYSFTAITTRDPPGRAGRQVHRDQPGRDRPVPRGLAARDRLGRRADREGHRPRAVLRRQAEPADDAVRAALARRALGVDADDRRPDGHRRPVRAGGRSADDSGAHRHLHGRRRPSGSRTGRAG